MSRWMRRSDHPNRPKAITCCFFDSFKTLLTSTEGTRPRVRVNVLSVGLSLAGFQVITYGRFWVITEAPFYDDAQRLHLRNADVAAQHNARQSAMIIRPHTAGRFLAQ